MACGADERHTLGVWDWKTGALLAQSATVKMSPPKLVTLVRSTNAIAAVNIPLIHMLWQ